MHINRAAAGGARRLRILIVALNFAPEPTGVGKYTGEMAAWFASRGHRVSVIAGQPYYPEWARAGGYRGLRWRSENWHGCRVIRCPIYIPRHLTGLRRLAHLFSFAASSIPAAMARLEQRFDVVAGIAPTMLSAPLALVLGKWSKAKTWLHIQDLEVDAARDLGLFTNERVIRAALRAESWITRRFDLVSTIAPKMLEALVDKGVRRERLALIPNWVDTTRIHPIQSAETLRAEFGVPADACVALYSGSMGHKQGLESVVTAARTLAQARSSKIVFVLAGAGPARPELERAATGLPNVRFLPLIEEQRFNGLLNIADIHVLPQRRGASDLVMPSKLGPMLAVGKPVLATVPENSQVAELLHDAGIVVPPEDPGALAGALSELVNNPQRRFAMGEAALKVARDYYDAATILPMVEQRLINLKISGNRSRVHGDASYRTDPVWTPIGHSRPRSSTEEYE